MAGFIERIKDKAPSGPSYDACNPRKVLFTLILFLETVRRVRGSGECFYKARELCADSSNQKRHYLL